MVVYDGAIAHLTDWVSDASSFGDRITEIAGRLCYMSFDKRRPGGNKAYLKRIKESGHGSVMEHWVCALLIEDVSRSLSHELIRHRAGMSYSQLSQRFVHSRIEFVIPPAYLNRHLMIESFKDDCREALSKYREWIQWLESEGKLSTKRVREAARSILPNATATKLVATGNTRAWRNFLEQRCQFGDHGADLEIARLAKTIYDVLITLAPESFADYTFDENGSIQTPFKKV